MVLAVVLARHGDSVRAAQLVGAVSASGTVHSHVERQLLALANEAAGTTGRQAWKRGLALGRHLSLDEAVALALEEGVD